MDSDRGLVKMPSLARKSMNFIRDAYQVAAHNGSSFKPQTGAYNQSFQPSQGLSHHFNQPNQHQSPYLQPHSPAHNASWPPPLPPPQNHSTPNLGSYSPLPQQALQQTSYPLPHQSLQQTSYPSPQQSLQQTPYLPTQQSVQHAPSAAFQDTPLQPYQNPIGLSQSPPAVSTASSPSNIQWTASIPANPEAPHSSPPPYHSIQHKPSLAAANNSAHSQNPEQQQQVQQTQKPVPMQIFSPDDYHEIWQSESAQHRPPKPAASPAAPQVQAPHSTSSPMPQPQYQALPPQGQYQTPSIQQQHQIPASPHHRPPLQYSYSAPHPSQSVDFHQQNYPASPGFPQQQYPNTYQQYNAASITQDHPQPFYQQQYPPNSPTPLQNPNSYPTQGNYANSSNPQTPAPHPQHSQTWPQQQQQQQQPLQPQTGYFGYDPPSQAMTSPVPSVAVSPPPTETPPSQPHWQTQHHQHKDYAYQGNQSTGTYSQTHNTHQTSPNPVYQHQTYQAHVDNKPPVNMYSQVQHPAVAELPG